MSWALYGQDHFVSGPRSVPYAKQQPVPRQRRIRGLSVDGDDEVLRLQSGFFRWTVRIHVLGPNSGRRVIVVEPDFHLRHLPNVIHPRTGVENAQRSQQKGSGVQQRPVVSSGIGGWHRFAHGQLIIARGSTVSIARWSARVLTLVNSLW